MTLNITLQHLMLCWIILWILIIFCSCFHYIIINSSFLKMKKSGPTCQPLHIDRQHQKAADMVPYLCNLAITNQWKQAANSCWPYNQEETLSAGMVGQVSVVLEPHQANIMICWTLLSRCHVGKTTTLLYIILLIQDKCNTAGLCI